MKILITNDDGYGTEGISVLEAVLAKAHDIYVIAPKDERSGSSNAFTVKEPITLSAVDERHFILGGYPADCVNVGLKAEIIPKVECVVSGINLGPNLGDDVFFSGTVGAARTAYIAGLTAFALSLNTRDAGSPYFRDAAEFLLGFLEEGIPKVPALFNINHPDREPAGIRYAVLARRHYGDKYAISRNGNDMALSLEGQPISSGSEDNDAGLLAKGFITITPLTTDCCDHSALECMQAGNHRAG